MRELLVQYFNIAFLMGKPQDLPGGDQQLKIGIGLAVLTYMMALLVPFGIGRAVIQATIDLLCTGLAMYLALIVVGRQARFAQAFGGLCGASAFINLAALPLYNMMPRPADADESSMTLVAEFVLLVWGLSLLAHVIRHTFEVKMLISVIASFVYFIVLSSLIAALLPAPQRTALKSDWPVLAYASSSGSSSPALRLP